MRKAKISKKSKQWRRQYQHQAKSAVKKHFAEKRTWALGNAAKTGKTRRRLAANRGKKAAKM
jgi:type I site-specific restriction endonuclease